MQNLNKLVFFLRMVEPLATCRKEYGKRLTLLLLSTIVKKFYPKLAIRPQYSEFQKGWFRALI